MARVGIIGAGLIGAKRAKALRAEDKLIAVADLSRERATALATSYGAEVETDWQKLVQRKDIDIVVVATSNNAIPICASEALKNQKHILIEKPGGRNPTELKSLLEISKTVNRAAKVGFNHRFHPAMLKAKSLIEEGAIGELMYFRARYGHGGRIGYDKEWRANPEISGGGELLDQGVHLIDLCRWMGGEFHLKSVESILSFGICLSRTMAFCFCARPTERDLRTFMQVAPNGKIFLILKFLAKKGNSKFGDWGEVMEPKNFATIESNPKWEYQNFHPLHSQKRTGLGNLSGKL
ncbi:MAG: Gfo/Idh/MocA family protein [Deltaproteobacteria bacterium]